MLGGCSRVSRAKLLKTTEHPIRKHCYCAKVVLFYKMVFSPNDLFALECYTTWNRECEKLFNYLGDRYKNFNDGLCIFDSGEDVQYALKECLDPTLRNTILNYSPMLGKGLTVREIIADITIFAKENFHYEPSVHNFRVCEIK